MSTINEQNAEAFINYTGPVPGQSLTNSSDSKQPWELPPQFVNKRQAELYILEELTEKEEGLIKQFYEYRIRLQDKLGIPFHVDHIVPLSKGGLHHPSNLQVVPASWNRSKHNRHTERWLPNGM